MKRKLELADIAAYLPYGLKTTIDKNEPIASVNFKYQTIGMTIYWDMFDLGDGKPILRPMSDLTKPMTHPDVNSGEEFVPLKHLLLSNNSCVRWEIKESIYQIEEYRIKQGLIEASYQHPKHNTIKGTKFLYLTCKYLQILSQLHFDYNDLIGQGLAIDINTLKPNDNE